MTGSGRPGPLRPDWDRLYRDRIAPALAARQGAPGPPRWVFVCGQQGSGKSTTVSRLLADLGAERTQAISSDALSALLPELYADPEAPEVQPALQDFRRRVRGRFIDRLADHAISQQSHVLWERPNPGNMAALARRARARGYRVECLVLALPIAESWLATLHRSLAPCHMGGDVVQAVAYPLLRKASRQWPAFLARAEAEVLFDTLTVLDRDQRTCFENVALPQGPGHRWTDPPFAFESLVIERFRPRSAAMLQAMADDLAVIMAHPLVAFRNRTAWPWQSFRQFHRHLADLAADPASQFDLTDPGALPAAARPWISRLQTELAEILAEAATAERPALAARAGALLDLAARVADQPTR